jgi:general secretion pathway protein L
MATTSLLPSAAHWSRVAVDLARRAGRCWLREFLALFPASVADWLIDRGGKRLVLAADEGGIDFELSTERGRVLTTARVATAEYSPDLVEAFLRAQGLTRSEVSLGLRLPAEHIFARKLLLPRETERTLGPVLANDLVAKTPLRLDGIYHDHALSRAGDKLHVWHWVVKRTFIADAVEALGLKADEVAFVEATTSAGEPCPRIRLRQTAGDDGRWVRRSLIALAVSACLLALVAVNLKYRAQQQILDDLASELRTTRAKAQRVRAALDQLQTDRAAVLKLRALKQSSNLLDIWEEITRVLPSHSWLTEMRLSEMSPGGEAQVGISGFSPAAASLVGVIDRSGLFRDAALTAPVAIDPTEGKERFTIQARLKPGDRLRTAAR